MSLTLDVSPELERKLQAEAEAKQISVDQLVEDILMKSLKVELTLAEIEKRYADEWVVINETDWDEVGEPTKGIIIAHSVDRDALTKPIGQFRGQNPEAITYTFYTGDPIPEGVMFIL